MVGQISLNDALAQMVTLGASDLHLSVYSPPVIRLDGELQPLPGDHGLLTAESIKAMVYPVLTDQQRQQLETERELDFAYSAPSTGRFRVNLYWQRNSLGAALRHVHGKVLSFAELGMPETIADFAHKPRGLVLVTGPTGSGKSTTLAALLDVVNTHRAVHIMTVEDPIEFLHRHKRSVVNQREVGSDTHSFASALKHVLRQDPDVILVGELRDLESISTALTAAETGHLVFATLHTVDAAQSIDRIIDVFPPHQQDQVRTQLAGSLEGIVSQTLLKKQGGGRIAATEVLRTTPAIKNLIRESKTHQIYSLLQAGSELGMHSMEQSLAGLVVDGTVTYAEAQSKSSDVKSFTSLAGPAPKEAALGADSMASVGLRFDDEFGRG